MMSARLAVAVCLAFGAIVSAAPPETRGLFVVGAGESGFVCRAGTAKEAARIPRAAREKLRTQREGVRTHAGLNIVLQTTAQLDANPAAKAAFERAAAIWESKIADPVTIYIAVDFGPTLFGIPFQSHELGVTYTDDAGVSYTTSRLALASHATSAGETALYALLPAIPSLPTDVGTSSTIYSPSAQLRTLGILQPATPGSSGPEVAFNSAFSFDFDPSNGIAAQSIDFEAMVVHELGHALGFISDVGGQQVYGESLPSIMDFFRVRPAITTSTFLSAQRVQSPGGEQVLFGVGGTKTPMSTAAPDYSGGDGQQASHWKDHQGIGVMDPTLAYGERSTLTAADLAAFDLLGWTIVASNPSCTATATSVCLLNERFRVSINYRNPFSNPPGATGDFVVRRLNAPGSNPDVATFGFSDANAVEVVVRIQDTRPFAPRFDIYYGGMTDVEYWVNITDTQTGATKQYYNPIGKVGGGVDRATFPAN
jgi:hypothetical protein